MWDSGPAPPSCLVGGCFFGDHFLFLSLYLGQTVAGVDFLGFLSFLSVVGDDPLDVAERVSPVSQPGQVVLFRG